MLHVFNVRANVQFNRDYEAEDNVLKGVEGFAQTLLKIKETSLQMLLKLEADRADRELTMMKWKVKADEKLYEEKRETTNQ